MVGRRPDVRGFELQDLVGRGGFSTVYRAIQPRLNRVVAVKVIDADIQADEDARRRFERECQTMGSLTGHHAVVTVHEVGECEDGQPYIAMELLEGGSLQDRLAEGVLPWPEVVAIGAQVAEALDAAHELGILHRDVKPANVMRDRFGHHKLGDFGIAGLAASAHTTAGAAPATVAYAAPEVLLGKRASTASDVYGLGATLFSLLTGGPAFAAATDESVVPMVMRITRDPLPELPDAVAPQQLRRLIGQMMAKDPADRPADAASIASTLKTIEAAHLLGETRASIPSPAVSGAESAGSTASGRTLPDTIPDAVPPEATGPGATPSDAVPWEATTDELDDATVLRVPVPTGSAAPVEPPSPPLADDAGEGARAGRVPLGRRARAVAVDVAVLAAALAIVAGIILPLGEPRSGATIIVRGTSVSLDRTDLLASDFSTTLTVANDTDEVVRIALQPSDDLQLYPEGGATVRPAETRTFGVPQLPAGTYDIVKVRSDGTVTEAFDGSTGDGLLEAIPAASMGIGTLVLGGVVLAALVLAFGWPIPVLWGGVALWSFIAHPTDAWLAARAGYALAALLLSALLEVGMRAWRRRTVGEATAGITVVAPEAARVGLGRLLVRWIAKPLSAIPLFAGYWWPRSQGDDRTWHDRLAGIDFTAEPTHEPPPA